MPGSTLPIVSMPSAPPASGAMDPSDSAQVSPLTGATATDAPIISSSAQAITERAQSCGTILSMPVDVMLHIFVMGTHCDNDGDAQFPVLVSHVCRSWRDIALNTCTLWTKIVISSASIARSTSLPVGPVVPKASTFILRSRGCPLDIKLHIILPRDGDLRVDVGYLYIRMFTNASIELIASVHTRIRTLDICTDLIDTTFLVTRRLLPLGMPMLEAWRIKSTADNVYPVHMHPAMPPPFAEFDASGQRGGWLGTEATSTPMESLLPRLKQLKLTSVNATWTEWNIGGLTSLTLNHLAMMSRPKMSELHAILAKNSHSLERLEILGCLPPLPVGWTGLARHRQPHLVLPKLRELRLGYALQIEALRFLVSIQFPSLKTLSLVDLARTSEVNRRKAIVNSTSASGLSFPMGLPDLNYDYRFDSSYLVVTLYTTCPTLLAQIETLEMVNLWIAQRPPIGSDALSISISNQFIYPARFFMALSSLKTLLLHGADRYLLQALNQVVPVRRTQSAKARSSFTYPGSQITRLRILHSDYDDITRFLYDRIEIARHLARHPEFPEKLPVFHTLELSVQPKYVAPFTHECTGGKLRGMGLISKAVSYSVMS